jgi:complement component 1 Q subcomponent-binding protein
VARIPRIIHHHGVLTPTIASARHFSVGLSDILAREMAEEEESGSAEMTSDLEELHQEVSKAWTILDDKDSGTVKMVRKGAHKVSIVFHCQDSIEVDYDDEGEEAAPEIRFTLTSTKAGKTLVMQCVSAEAIARVESVATTAEDVDHVFATGKIDPKLYQGPEFVELAEDLQEAFHSYLQTDCGVNDDVAAFISMYADFKEQEEYVRWLKQVQGIIG